MSQAGIANIGVVPPPPTVVTKLAPDIGINPVVPAAGIITVNGTTVSAGTNPVRTDGTTASTMAIEVQLSQAIASTNAANVGLSAFDSAAFDVDANGFVQLNGGGIASTAFDVQSNTAPGVDPVVSTPTGIVTINGAVVENHSVVLETHSRAPNTYNLEVQYATTTALSDGTKSGVAHFNSAQFIADANGFISTSGTGVANTITGNNNVVLSPTAGNWNILGRSGSKTNGSGSTLTVNSPPYANQGSTGISTLNSGEFVTAISTRTTPASVGLLDGDLLEYVVINGPLTIQLTGTQVAHVGSLTTSAAGTITSTLTGDSISLRYQASTDDWWATSVIGTWLMA